MQLGSPETLMRPGDACSFCSDCSTGKIAVTLRRGHLLRGGKRGRSRLSD